MKRVAIVFLLILIILALARSSVVTLIDSEEEFVPYENKSLGIAINYPEEWTIKASQHSVTFIPPDETFNDSLRETFTIVVVDWSPHEVTFEEFTRGMMAHKAIGDGPPVVICKTLDNVPALTRRYSLGQVRFLQIDAVKDNKSYHITFYAKRIDFSEYIEILQEMIDSFRFIPEKMAILTH